MSTPSRQIRRAAVVVTKGETLPTVPEGVKTVRTTEGTVIYDPKQIGKDGVRRAVREGRIGELMGHVEKKPEAPAGVVVARHPETGTEIQSSYVSSPEKATGQAEAFAAQHPGAAVEVGGADLERKLLAERQATQLGGDEAIRYKGRDIVHVEMPDGSAQPFYRSTGNNSRRAGEWFPFDGVGADEQGELLLKGRFSSGEMEDPAHPLHRLGSDEMKAVSEQLRGADIKPGREVSTPDEVNS